MHRPGVELAISRSQFRRPSHYTTKASNLERHRAVSIATARLSCYAVGLAVATVNAVKIPGSYCHDTVVGLTCLGDELFVLRDRDVNRVEVYSTNISENFALLRHFSVAGLGKHVCNDMTSCAKRRCLYISDWKNKCVHKSALNGNVSAK